MVCFNISLFFIFAFLSVIENKKYDVEEEAQKLYGQNLGHVIARFRKTADYVKILTDKAKHLNAELAEAAGLIWFYMVEKMEEHIKDMAGLNTITTADETASPGSDIRNLQKKILRRQDVTEIDAERQKKIDRIDNYPKLTSSLTLKERNEYKDVGFKFVGDAIHMTIENMGVKGADAEFRSTRMPDDRPNMRHKVTTAHARDHKVTKVSRPELIAMDSINDETRKKIQNKL